jgi:predicted DNA repair protein MutK
MASSLLALLDDIATVLDDVAVLTKVAARKTAGVLGDDLALNAQQVAGVRAERELPVVWAVARGSARNKAILVPAALAISAFAPWAVTPLLMVGGAFLCFEGFEKLAHRFLHSRQEDEAHHAELTRALADPAVDLVALERDKIQGAVRTDFILSAEIIAITLGTVAASPFATQLSVLLGIAVAMTVGVYGLVAGIVKLDDAGLWLSQRAGDGPGPRLQRQLGAAILRAAPWLMKFLTVAGTAAMFLVGGGILTHGIPWLHHAIEAGVASVAAAAAGLSGLVTALGPVLADGLLGVVAGALALVGVTLVQRSLRAVRALRGPAR